jgi:NADH-quinone oxidoreductase subunit I
MGKPRQYSWWERLYFPEVFRGLFITSRHFWVNVLGFLPVVGRFFKDRQETITYQWPEEERPIHPRWRGRHRLNKREDGTIKCVACFCCATACPSECIHIVARERTDGVEEKEPAVFEIDLFRCVYCGMCVEACPLNAILMDTQDMRFCQYSPDKFIIGKDELLDW